jgi:hypothetical protein
MVSFSLRQRISLPPPTGPHSGVLSFESIRGKYVTGFALATLSLGHSYCWIATHINAMELIYITSQKTYYNLARLLRMQYQPGKDEILEGEILLLEGGRHFDDRKRTGRFTSTSQLDLTFSAEPLDVVHLTGEEADKVYEDIMSMSPLTKSPKKAAR